MIALAIAALALAAAPMGMLVWLVPKLIRKTEGGADTGIALAATEAELERVKGELATSDLKLKQSAAACAIATGLAQRLTAKLKELRHEDLDHAGAADLLAAVDRLSREASGEAPAGPDSGTDAPAGRVPIDPWATEGTKP